MDCQYCGKDTKRIEKTFEVFFPTAFYSRTMYACCENQLKAIIRDEWQLKRIPKNTAIIQSY